MSIDITSLSIGGTFGAALGYLLRVIIEHFLIKSRATELRRQEDADKAKRHFRSIIAQEIADIRTRKHIFKDSSHINPLHKAMLEYYPFLSKEGQAAIDTAWKEYQDHEEYRAWTTQKENSPMPEPDPWPKTEAVKYLKNLLKFTE